MIYELHIVFVKILSLWVLTIKISFFSTFDSLYKSPIRFFTSELYTFKMQIQLL